MTRQRKTEELIMIPTNNPATTTRTKRLCTGPALDLVPSRWQRSVPQTSVAVGWPKVYTARSLSAVSAASG